MGVVVQVADASDDPGIRMLVRQAAMPGHIRMAFPREPHFSIGCAATGDENRVLVARSETGGSVVGVACRSVRRVFLNGSTQRIGYLGQLRIHDDFRGRWLVPRGFALLERIHQEDPVPAYLIAIVDGNHDAIALLVSRRRRSFPEFRKIARYRTVAIPVTRSRPGLPGVEEIVPGSLEQLPDIVEFLRGEGKRRQLFSVLTVAALHRLAALGLTFENIRVARQNGAIVGVMALWDQSAYKQAIVCGYSGWFAALAQVSRLAPRWLVPPMPRPGGEVRIASAALVCIAEDNRRVFARLLREIHNRAQAMDFDYLLVGLDCRDPLLKVARRYRHFSYRSGLYLGSWDKGGLHVQLDDRPVYVDVGSL